MIKIVDESNGAIERYSSIEEYNLNGHNWCWCLVGNIVKEHKYGEEHEVIYGTKHFSYHSKVYLAPIQWGDGYENVVVIGFPRHGYKVIEIIIKSRYIENYRMQKVYKPAILKRMCSSKHWWWGDTENDRRDIIEYLETRAPEEAEKQKQILDKKD